jgi:tRNA(Ile)-lysidine synthase
MLFQTVRAILKKECFLPDEGKLLVGVSGGPDSVCLLDILSQLPYEVIVGHLNHNLRPSSTEEMDFVEKLAAKYGCKFVGKSSDILEISKIKKTGIEETARRERYHFLFDSAKNENAKGVLVAHQADDQIETLMENLIRGAGLEGMVGMKVRSISEFNHEIPLVRPLLRTWREEILNYCQNHHLEYRLDETNQSLAYTRSSIRNHLIPELIRYNPNIKNTLLRTQQVLAEDFDFLQDSIEASLKDIHLVVNNEIVELNLKAFKNLSVSMQRLVVKNILEKYYFSQDIISFSNIEYSRKMLNRELRRTLIKISDQLYIFTSGTKGVFTKNSANELVNSNPRISYELTLVVRSGKYPINEKWEIYIEEMPKDQIEIDFYKNRDVFTAYFDKEKLDESLTIRTWIKGDRFQPLGMKGKSIKLTDYWINRKIPPMARNIWPLVVNKDAIIWIPGLQQDHNSRVTNETQNIFILRLKRISEEK